jgi:hypothetical protein
MDQSNSQVTESTIRTHRHGELSIKADVHLKALSKLVSAIRADGLQLIIHQDPVLGRPKGATIHRPADEYTYEVKLAVEFGQY